MVHRGGTLWVWHIPALYNATLYSEWVHAVAHLCFVLSATIYWHALLDPLEAFRLKPAQALIYLVSAGFVNSLLAIMITLAPGILYTFYENPPDRLGLLDALRERWGIDVLMDQQAGGALMWVLGSLVFLIAVMGVLVRWFRAPERDLPRLANSKSVLGGSP